MPNDWILWLRVMLVLLVIATPHVLLKLRARSGKSKTAAVMTQRLPWWLAVPLIVMVIAIFLAILVPILLSHPLLY